MQERGLNGRKENDEVTLKIERPKTFCGIIGVYGTENASSYIYYGLNALQHRGQEAAGIVTREKVVEILQQGEKKFFSMFIRTRASLRMFSKTIKFFAMS